MSDRLKDLELELRDVIVVLKDVAGTQWYDLGLQLRLSPSILDTIAADHQTADDCKRIMLRKWLQNDPEASWERLAAALTLTGYETTAAVIRRQFSLISISKDKDHATEEDKLRLMLTRKNLNKIKGQYSSLLLKVQAALKSHQVSVDNLRDFLVHYFSRGDWIHDPSNLDALFTALSIAKLWNYDHYDPLEEITKQFLPDDADVKKFVSDYKNQLTGFYTTSRIADFIRMSDFEDSEQDPEQPLPVHTFTFKDYRKLKLKLKIDRKVSAITLSYVDELWRSLAEEFDLPCLTAVIHSIIEGSLVVTWLILPHIAEKIMANSSKATKFFRHYGIVMVTIDERIIYDEELMVTFERELFSICDGFPYASRISQLLSYGVDLDISDEDGYTPLLRASMRGSTNVVKTLLHCGANVNQHSHHECDDTPLGIACIQGHIDIAKVLLDHGGVVDHPNAKGQSPLFVACAYKQTAAVKFLLEHGADVNLPTKDGSGCTTLFSACWYGCADVVRLLIDHGAVIDYQNLQGTSPLYIASQEGHLEVVQVLLEYGASVNLVNDDEQRDSALIIACQCGHSAIARVLLDQGATIDYRNQDEGSALFYACRNDQAETVKLLLEYGAEKNALSLYTASEHGFVEIVKLLLEYGVEVNTICKELALQKTALHVACFNGHSHTTILLIENGATINAPAEDGCTPLHLACTNRQSQIVSLLLSAGAMPDIVANDGVTSLMLAADQEEDSTDIVAALVEAKADPNIRDKTGSTALWYAAKLGNTSVVEMLLESGATMDVRDKTGLTAYDIASINSHPTVCDLLEQYGYQPHHSGVSGSSSAQQLRHHRDEITSLKTFRSILKHGASRSQDAIPKRHTRHQQDEITSVQTIKTIIERGSRQSQDLSKHQTSSHASEESEKL